MPAWWDEWLLPRAMDVILADRLAGPWRARVCRGARGQVLEIGFGTGRSLSYYGERVERVLAVEPSDQAWELSEPRRAAYRRPVERVARDAATIPLPDASVDTVVSQWTLCTIPQVESALGEGHRVLRPGGEFRFVEHTVAPERWVAGLQRRVQPVWGLIGGGCHLDRDILGLIERAGFTTPELDSAYAGRGLAKVPTWFVTGSARHT